MPGRNDPCPCGSGRKYKKCHLAADTAPTVATRVEEPSPLHALDHRVVEDIILYAESRFPFEWLEVGEDLESWPGMTTEFLVAWMCWIERFEGRTAADWYVESRGWSLSKGVSEWIESQRKTHLSIWEVIEVEAGRRVRLRDALTGEQRDIHEVAMTRSLQRQLFILARIVDHQGVSVAAGISAQPLGPLDAAQIIERVFKSLRRKSYAPPERLLNISVARKLLKEWTHTVDRLLGVPDMRTEDGDEIFVTTERWTFDPESKEEILIRFESLRDAFVDNDHVSLFKGETLIGSIDVAESHFVLSCLSKQRADAAHDVIAEVCGDLAVAGLRSYMDPRTFAEVDAPPEPEESDDHGALIRAYKEQHYAEWCDIPVPALNNRTPREASKTAAGRAALRTLLNDLEVAERRLPEPSRYDVNILRKELGVE